MRQAIFEGLREDIKPTDVVRERKVSAKKVMAENETENGRGKVSKSKKPAVKKS